MNKGLDFQDLDGHKMNPLMYACQSGNTQAVRLLLSNYKFNLKQKNSDGLSALHLAVIFNHKDIIQLLIDN